MMKTKRIFALILLLCILTMTFVACKSSVKIDDKKTGTHYLVFIVDDTEILKMVVLKGETYEDLCPYFPTVPHKEGYIGYWDGDYNYTEYSSDNQFVVWDSKEKEIVIYSHYDEC